MEGPKYFIRVGGFIIGGYLLFTQLVSAGTCTISSNQTYGQSDLNTCAGGTLDNLTINSSVTLTLTEAITVVSTVTVNGTILHNAADVDGVNITAAAITINSGGSINVNSKGCAGATSSSTDGEGPNSSTGICAVSTTGYGDGSAQAGGGAGYGGAGGTATGANAGATYGSNTTPTLLGSGGGAGPQVAGSVATGGKGGGLVRLDVSGALTVNGTISANGEDGATNGDNSSGGGGGSGGSIYITTATLAGGGSITANGGNGGNGSSSNGGGGGGGRIAIYYVTNSSTFLASMTAANSAAKGTEGGGGAMSATDGADGTLYTFNYTTSSQTWNFDNSDQYTYNSSNIDVNTNSNGLARLNNLVAVNGLAGWSKRKVITINNGGTSAQTNYQMRYAVTYDSDMQADFDDLRFTNSNGTLLDYWLESKTDSSSAVVWIEVPSIAASGNTIIYMYYGNATASSASDMANTFVKSDDFSDGTISTSLWTTQNNGNCSMSEANNVLTLSCTTSQNGDWWAGNNWGPFVMTAEPSGDWAAITKLNSYTVNTSTHAGIANGTNINTDNVYLWGRYYGGANNRFQVEELGTNNLASYNSTTLPMYLRIRNIGTTYYYDYSTDGSSFTNVYSQSAITGTRVGLFAKEWGVNAISAPFEFFSITAIASTEPTISSTGNEINVVAYNDVKIINTAAVAPSFANLASFSATLSGNTTGSVTYQISHNGTNWYYHNGTRWTAVTTDSTDNNTAAQVNAYLPTFSRDVGTGNFYFKAFLISDGSQSVEIDSLTLTYNALPATPTVSVGDNTRNPALSGNTYNGLGSHSSSSWKVTSDSNCSTIVWSKNNDSTNLTSITVNSTNGSFSGDLAGESKLAPNTTYYACLRYTNAAGNSAWSSGQSFTTAANSAPNTPTNSSPINGSTTTSKTVILDGSDYSESESDSHSSSEFKVYESSDCTGAAVADVTVSSGDLTQYSFSTTKGHTTFSWKVSYTDKYSGISSFSSCTNFTTPNTIPTKTSNIADQSTNEDTNINNAFDLDSYFSDDDSNDSLSYSVIDDPSPNITVSIGTGNVVSFTLAANWNGSDTIQFRASDGNGGTVNSNSITIIVSAVNDTPTFSGTISVTAWDEDSNKSNAFDLDTYFSDVDTGDSCTYSIIDNPSPNITVTVGSGNAVSFTPTSNWNGSETVQFRCTDAGSVTVDSNSITLTVNSVNDTPTTPTSGFSPANADVTSSQTPTISWTHATDIDNTSAELSYQLRIGTDADPINNYTYLYTSSTGSAQVTVTDTLADETTYYYAVRTYDGAAYSSWSAIQNLRVNTAYLPEITLTKTVDINPEEQVFNNFLIPVALAGSWQTTKDVFHPELLYFFLGLLVASLIYAVLLTKKPHKIHHLLWRSPALSFQAIHSPNRRGTYKTSYHRHKKHAFACQGLTHFSLIILVILLVSFIFYYPPSETLGVNETGQPVEPGDILTYTIAYENTGDGDATNAVITDEAPAGTVLLAADDLNLVTVPVGTSTTVQLTVQIPNPLATEDLNLTTIDNVANFSSNETTVSSNSVSSPLSFASIIGTLTDEENNPLTDVELTLFENDSELASTTSNSDGDYVFLGLGSGTYTITPEIPDGYQDIDSLTVVLSMGETKTEQNFSFTAEETRKINVPATPSKLSGQADSSTTITWTWKDNASDETGFKLYDNSDNLIATIASADRKSYQETSLTKGTSYTRYVVSYNDAGNSLPSAKAEATTRASLPASFSLLEPGNNEYTNNTRPTFKWEASADQDDGLAKYKLKIDNGETGDLVIDDIPVSRTSWDLSKNDGQLKEGRRYWEVLAYDQAGNVRRELSTLFVDQTGPDLEVTKINDYSFASSLTANDKTPTIYGKITDSLAGDKTGNKVASGPQEIEIKFAKRNALGLYDLHALITLHIDEFYWSDTEETITDNSQNRANKYSIFSYTPTTDLPLGIYQVTLTAKDKANNSSTALSFDLTIKTFEELIETPEAEEMVEELAEELEISPKEAEEIVKKEGLIIPEELEKPSKIAKATREVIAGITNFWWKGINTVKSLGRRTGQILVFITDKMGQGLVFSGQKIGEIQKALGKAYSNLAQKAPGVLGDGLLALGRGAKAVSRTVISAVNQTFSLASQVGNIITQRTAKLAMAWQTSREAIIQPASEVQNFINRLKIASSIFVSIAFDDQPNRIFDVRVEEITPTTAAIVWQTNHYATSKVNYGFSTSYGQEVFSNERVKEHRIVLENLEPGKLYYFEVMSQNKNYAYDAYYTFNTLKIENR